jgi:hypothetical protein
MFPMRMKTMPKADVLHTRARMVRRKRAQIRGTRSF